MDHFPGRPLVPGVLQIEMVAQTAGACIRIARAGMLTLLTKVRSAKFIRPISPGDQCRITADVTRLGTSYAISFGIVEVADNRVAEVEIMHAIVPRESLNEPDPVVDEWIKHGGGVNEQNCVETSSAAPRR